MLCRKGFSPRYLLGEMAEMAALSGEAESSVPGLVVVSQGPPPAFSWGPTTRDCRHRHPRIPMHPSGLPVEERHYEKNVQSFQRLSCVVWVLDYAWTTVSPGRGLDGLEFGSLLYPLVFTQWPIGNYIMTNRLVEVLYVSPFGRSAVLEPEADGPELGLRSFPSNGELIQAFDDPFVALFLASF